MAFLVCFILYAFIVWKRAAWIFFKCSLFVWKKQIIQVWNDDKGEQMMTEFLFLSKLFTCSASATFVLRPQTTLLCSVLIYYSLWACAQVKKNHSTDHIKAQQLTDLISQLQFSSGIQTIGSVMMMMSQTDRKNTENANRVEWVNSHLPLHRFCLNTFPFVLQVA